MRTSIAIVLAFSLSAAASCRKDGDTTNPDAASGESMLGLDVADPSARNNKKKGGTKVSVGCIQDPADPNCAEILGTKQSSSGELEFTGDACRVNLCNGHGECELDSDGFVACACEEGLGGQNCDQRKKK